MSRPHRVVVRAYAKLNLHLEVLGRRPDRFHEILTLMQTVDLWDRLTLTRAPGPIRLTIRPPGLDPGPQNLICRALEALRARFKVKEGAQVRLWKRIPTGAGLGGGSSDAAAALVAGSRLWGLRPAPPALRALAASLGSDVPFFLHGSAAWMGGRGERVLRRVRLPRFHAVVVYPSYEVFSRDAYRGLDLPLTRVSTVSSIRFHSLRRLHATQHILDGSNAFAAWLYHRHPRLIRLRNIMLAAGATGVRPTGSGSAIFGIMSDARSSRQLTLRMRLAGYPAWSVRPTERGMKFTGRGVE